MTLPDPNAHEVEAVRSEMEVSEWTEEFQPQVEAGAERIETEHAKFSADAEELVSNQERSNILRNSLLPVAAEWTQFEKTVAKIKADHHLSEEGKGQKIREAREQVGRMMDQHRESFKNTSMFLISDNLYPRDPQLSNEEVARLNLRMNALASASPRRIITEAWSAIQAGRLVDADYIIMANERQLERSSPHWRPYIPLWRQVVDACRMKINGTELHHRERAARDLVGNLGQQFNWALATASKSGQFDDTIWIGAPDFNRGEK